MAGDVIFREVQYFRQPWLLAFLGVEVLFSVWAAVQQIVLGQPWGNKPASNELLSFIFFFTGFVLPAFVLSTHLRTEVRREGIVYRFFPLQLHERTIPRKDISGHKKVTYRPLRDYGGWGIRYGRRGTAYNVGGNQGVVLTLNGGREILFGTKQPDALDLAIGAMIGGTHSDLI